MRHGQGFEEAYREYCSLPKKADRPSAVSGALSTTVPYLYRYRKKEVFALRSPYKQKEKLEALLVRISNQIHALSGSRKTNNNIPAGYTYLCQFAIHDIINSAVLSGADKHRTKATALNHQSPSFDLNALYGVGDIGYAPLFKSAGPGEHRGLFRFGFMNASKIGGAYLQGSAHDIARIAFGPSCEPGETKSAFDPLLADTRNADNLILMNIVILFQEFHNIIYTIMKRDFSTHPDPARTARHLVERAYRSIIDNDLAPRLFGRKSWDAAKERRKSGAASGLTAESVFAALRFGHTMVRSRYAFNDQHDDALGSTSAGLENLLKFSGQLPGDEVPVHVVWKIDWRRFFDLSETPGGSRHPRLNFASLFGPSMATALRTAAAIKTTPPHDSHGAAVGLAYRTLMKGVIMQLPTAQALLTRLNQAGNEISVMDRELIRSRVTRGRDSVIKETTILPLLSDEDIIFLSENTPLFFYLLIEAETLEDGRRLGPLGGFLVGNVFAEALSGADRQTEPVSIDLPSTMAQLVNFVEQNKASMQGGSANAEV